MSGRPRTAALNLFLCLARELAGRGVRVQTVLPGATAAAFWGGTEGALPAGTVMAVDELVDAALSGFNAGEEVTISSLPEQTDWDAYSAARTTLAVNLSRQHPADRYRRAA